MDEQRHVFHHYLRGLILAGMSLFLFRLAVNDSLKYYLAPKMKLYLYGTMILLGLFGVIQLCASGHNEEHCPGCDHHHDLPRRGLPTLIFYGLFLFPILSGFTFPDHTLGSAIAAGRQMHHTASAGSVNRTDQNQGHSSARQTNSSNGQALTQNQLNQLKDRLLKQEKITIDNKNYTNIMTIITQNSDRFRGKRFEVTGFVYRDKTMRADEINTARFVITCCIADASVYGLLTKGPVAHLKKDAWVTVSGTLDDTLRQGQKQPLLRASDVTVIPQPAHPYVYDYGIRLD